jgi:ribonuclease J
LAVPGARLVLDLGLPLDAKLPRARAGEPVTASIVSDLLATGILPAVDGLYSQGTGDPIIALVVSHAHADHYGLAHFASPEIPLVTGRYARRLMDLTARIMGAAPIQAQGPELVHGVSLQLGPFRITPFLVDHSAFDAYAVLVEADGKRVFYSGDLRAHGRKAGLFEWLLKQGPRDVDALMLEGTTLSRSADSPRPSEQDIEVLMESAMLEAPGLVLVWSSGQNIDRLVTVFRAAHHAGRRLLLDPYTALVLDTLGDVGSLPRMEWGAIRVLFPERISSLMKLRGFEAFMERARAQGIRWETVKAHPSAYVAMFRDSMLDDHIRHGTLAGARVFYSMWSGYLEEERNVRVVDAIHLAGGEMRNLHAGGHAHPEDLARLVKNLAPRCVIPIHTLAPDTYAGLGAPVTLLEEGNSLDL